MKPFLILVLIAGGAAGWWFLRTPAPTDGEGAVTDTTGIPGPDGVPAPTADPNAVPGPGAVPPPAGGGDAPTGIADAYAQAEALWTAAAAASPEDPARHASAPDLARRYTAILRSTYADPASTAFADRLVAERLTPLGTALFFSRNRYEDELFALHTVQSGDVPDRIARQYGMSYQHLNRLRGRDINDSALRVGETLKVIRQAAAGGTSMHVSKSAFRLDLFVGGVFARRYDIAIGAPATPTPVGKTFVTNLVYNPQWTDPVSGKVFEPGDPGNILGGVWLALDPDGIQGKTGIGLHGYTGNDRSLRIQASNGCLRLDNDQVKELSYVVSHPQRSPCTVEIVP